MEDVAAPSGLPLCVDAVLVVLGAEFLPIPVFSDRLASARLTGALELGSRGRLMTCFSRSLLHLPNRREFTAGLELSVLPASSFADASGLVRFWCPSFIVS